MSDEKFTSENMKVKHVLMIAVVLLAMLVVPVAAEDTSTTTNEKTQNVDIGTTIPVVYEISIPPSGIDFGDKTSITEDIGVIITTLDPSTHINLTVVSTNGWSLIHTTVSTVNPIEYNMTVTETEEGNSVTREIKNSDSLLKSSETCSMDVTFNLIGKATKAGYYSDTLRFTASVESGFYVYTGQGLQDAINNGETDITLGGDMDLSNGLVIS